MTSGPKTESSSIQLTNLQVRLTDRTLLEATNQSIPDGRLTVIVGASGAGKSVLLRVLAGLQPKDSAEIQWNGAITDQSGEPLRHVGIVFQNFALFDELSARENVQFAIDHRSDSASVPEMSAKQWLSELGVPERTRVSAMSGGQKQRLAIARTLAADPQVILYDEPTSGLDAASGQRVAELIRRVQTDHGRTSIIVTHDYETLIPIADHVLLFDSNQRALIEIPESEWESVADRIASPVVSSESPIGKPQAISKPLVNSVLQFCESTTDAIIAAMRLPLDSILRPPAGRWSAKFLLHYLRLIAGPSAWVYLILAGIIVGFSATFFTFRYLPMSLYTKPLLIEDLLASIGFVLYRILVPVMATILIAARCGAAVVADVGVKKYGAQFDSMKGFGIRPTDYLLSPIVFAFIIATPVLEWICFTSAKWTSLLAFVTAHPGASPYFWQLHFESGIAVQASGPLPGVGWILLKNLLCGIGIAAISYYRGAAEKHSTRDVSDSITSTILWTTLLVLSVHFLVAFAEF